MTEIVPRACDPDQMQWVRDHGLDPNLVKLAPIPVDDDGQLHFTVFMRGENGKLVAAGKQLVTGVVVVAPTRPFPS
jgi:hypothetical protein